MLPPYKESKESLISDEEIKSGILDEYRRLGSDLIVWRNDTPFPNGTKITLGDLSYSYINTLINTYSKCECVNNDTYVMIFKNELLKRRLEKIEKIRYANRNNI